MSIEDQFAANARRLFVKPEDSIGRMVHASMGISGEAGEILLTIPDGDCHYYASEIAIAASKIIDDVKKTWIYGKELDKENVLEECGDILFYVSVLLAECGFTIGDAMRHNVAKLQKRYPEGYSDQHAIARQDKQ